MLSNNSFTSTVYNFFAQDWGNDDTFMATTLIGVLIMSAGLFLELQILSLIGATIMTGGLLGFFFSPWRALFVPLTQAFFTVLHALTPLRDHTEQYAALLTIALLTPLANRPEYTTSPTELPSTGFFISEGNSMLPTIGEFGIIRYTQQPKYHVGDIIIFYTDDEYIVHRIIQTTDTGFITQGDNNDKTDQEKFNYNTVTPSNILGQVSFSASTTGFSSLPQ